MHHGEYKVPGGKLIVADFNLTDGIIHDVQLSGDFFLSPEETLGRMAATLEGMTVMDSDEAIADEVRAAAGDAELIGITPEGVAQAIRRGIAGGEQ